MRKLLSAMVIVFSMGMTGSVFAQDYAKGVKAYEEKDYATALKEFRFFAERRHENAQAFLGLMYYNGEGVVQDYKEAVSWYRKAAEQGNTYGQVSLGAMYRMGQGVVQDYKEAVSWYRKAVEQGNTGAQANMALMYQYGRGVIQDNVYAHMWSNISASNGNENASKYRDEIAKKMTAAEIAKAQELARECVKKLYKGC